MKRAFWLELLEGPKFRRHHMADQQKYFCILSVRDDDGVLHHAGSVVKLSAKKGAALLKARYVQVANPAAVEVEGECPADCKEHKAAKNSKK